MRQHLLPMGMLRCTDGNADRSEPKGPTNHNRDRPPGPHLILGRASAIQWASPDVRGSTKVLSDHAFVEPMLRRRLGIRSGCLWSQTYPRRDERQPSFEKGGIVSLFLRREEGQGLAEYAIIGSLI